MVLLVKVLGCCLDFVGLLLSMVLGVYGMLGFIVYFSFYEIVCL